MYQRTICHEIGCSGIALHSGKKVKMKLLPADIDTGIIFNIVKKNSIKTIIHAKYDRVVISDLCTSVENTSGQKVSTIEHLMAALWDAKIDNIVIVLDGDEVPILDGSSEKFSYLLECAGIQKQGSKKKYIEILQEVSIKEEDSSVTFYPDSGFKVNVEIFFDHPKIGKQNFEFDSSKFDFRTDIARARTFGFMKDVKFLKENGLILGGSLANAIVLDSDKVVNKSGLRFSDEFVRHKILDVIGDLFLAGCEIKGKFYGVKPSHYLNNKLLRKLFENSDNYRITEAV